MSKCPAVARVGGGGGWAPLELTDALEAKKYFTIVTTNASFCLFICAFVFASNSGHFRINDVLLFFTPLLLLNYFLFNLFLFLQKSGPPVPPSAWSLK